MNSGRRQFADEAINSKRLDQCIQDNINKENVHEDFFLLSKAEYTSVLPMPFLQGAAPCPFLMTPCPFKLK